MSYKDLKSYQGAVVIYDFTSEFCRRYVDKKSRTFDQMIQAARSGKQNIAEGSANRTSEKSELKLLGVARASFAELLEDYEDFLRQNNLRLWGKNDSRAMAIRGLGYKSDKSYRTYQTYIAIPETAANAAICLIHQVNFLLDRQIGAAENQYENKGDYEDQLKRKAKDFWLE
jgi:four helix bundle suffix protein